ncbi:hypothetical protein Pelo_18312 [Pelomyxa schiedti]|nr:hypothetical protein Pelo_18312 [Pelomyxa schiedti]
MEKSRGRTNTTKAKSPASKSPSSNSSSTIPKSKPKKKLHEPTSRLWVALDYTLEGVVVVLLVVTLFNLAMRHFVDSKLKPSGQVIGTGHFGEALHVKCVGPEGGPLVILEGGLMQGHNVFVLVQESLQREGIASCSYDREGYGFSPRSGDTIGSIEIK